MEESGHQRVARPEDDDKRHLEQKNISGRGSLRPIPPVRRTSRPLPSKGYPHKREAYSRAQIRPLMADAVMDGVGGRKGLGRSLGRAARHKETEKGNSSFGKEKGEE